MQELHVEAPAVHTVHYFLQRVGIACYAERCTKAYMT